MFNRDITSAFSRMNTKPTQQFKDHLKARIVPDIAQSRAVHPFRMFVFAGASLVLVFGVVTVFRPTNVNKALASAIQNTFAFSAEGYHHLKIQMDMSGQSDTVSNMTEMWTDGTHAIIDFDGTNTGSEYFDQVANVKCDYLSPESTYGPAHEPSCDVPEFLSDKMTNAHSDETKDLAIKEIAVEHATDTHGDLYVTWTTDRPLGVTLANYSHGPYGYEFGTFNGTYSWQNDARETVNRVTLFFNDIAQSVFPGDVEKSFLVQLKEIAPEDVGSNGPFEGTPISQSKVYLVDLETMTVTPVTDEWLEQSRKVFNDRLTKSIVSTETIKREYESSFQYAIDIGNRLDSYTRVSVEQGIENGKAVEYVAYDLDLEDPIIIDTIPATRATFTREVDTNLIRDMKLFSVDGTMIYRAQLLAFEEQPSAPDGIFSRDAWESHVKNSL